MDSVELDLLLEEGVKHLENGHREAAHEVFTRITHEYPQNADAHFHLAIVAIDQKNPESAIRHFESFLKIRPDIAEVHFNIGTLLSELGRREEAAEAFRKTLELDPEMVAAYNNLGVLLRDSGQLQLARESFEKAVSITPGYVPAVINLGNLLATMESGNEVINLSRRVCELNPDLADARFALGLTLDAVGESDEAMKFMSEAIELRPDSAEWQYHLAAVKGLDTPATAPADYVAALFDGYASGFDEHLRNTLKYQAPEQLYKAVASVLSSQNRLSDKPQFTIMDLGCGTGLCGNLFRPVASRLTGIDLSQEMIREAEKRGCYDELRVQSIADSLSGSAAEYDLILGADVLNYIGDLTETFQLASTAIRPNGLFAFTTEAMEELKDESTDTDSYALSSTRRYIHKLGYLRKLAAIAGFAEQHAALETLRCESGKDVKGWITVWKKSSV